ncbi:MULTISPECIES: hypothetical protein [unclassified Cryobacterium]|uniref:hypothetical protein n=1 Tax=unclassified Cryobacterium TaxID=2649013 RepID=UPI0011B00A8F|nr:MULTISPECIES: hypothetical protein [unclassified Cryobacterium]
MESATKAIVARYLEWMTRSPKAPDIARPLWHWTVPAVIVVAASIWITSALQPVTLECPAVFPTLEGCTIGVGMHITLVMSVILFGLFTALLLVGVVVRESHRSKFLQIVMVAIIIATLIGPLWTLGSFGFFHARQ